MQLLTVLDVVKIVVFDLCCERDHDIFTRIWYHEEYILHRRWSVEFDIDLYTRRQHVNDLSLMDTLNSIGFIS